MSRPFGDGEAEVGKDRRKLVHDLRDRMNAAEIERARVRRKRHVEGFAGKPRLKRCFLEDPRGAQPARC